MRRARAPLNLYLPGASDEEEQPPPGNANDDDDDSVEDFMSATFAAPADNDRPQSERQVNKATRKRPRAPEKTAKDENGAPGLSTGIGAQFLAKMGYKEGKGLGKNLDGVPTAIVPEVRSSRGGLGLESHKREKVAAAKQKKLVDEQTMKSNFRTAAQKRVAVREALADLHKLRRSIEQLDERDGREPHEIIVALAARDSESVTRSEDPTEQVEPPPELEPDEVLAMLESLIDYSRGTHFFCLYCGIKYDSAQDMADNCPGRSRDDH